MESILMLRQKVAFVRSHYSDSVAKNPLLEMKEVKGGYWTTLVNSKERGHRMRQTFRRPERH